MDRQQARLNRAYATFYLAEKAFDFGVLYGRRQKDLPDKKAYIEARREAINTIADNLMREREQ